MRCDNCGSSDLRIAEWWASDAMWLHVMGTYVGVLCAPCFDWKAKQAGWFLRWTPEQYPGVPAPVNDDGTSAHGDFLTAFGRSMVVRVAQAEEMVVILRRERDAALQQIALLRGQGGNV
jgi:hypothetical protein